MTGGPTQLSPPQRSKWFHITVGITLIVVAVALTVGWQILGIGGRAEPTETSGLR